MRVIKTSYEIKADGILIYQMNEYGHQRVFLPNDLIDLMVKLRSTDEIDEADAMFTQHQQMKEAHRLIYGD